MNWFDHTILLSLNHLADRSPILTKVVQATYVDSFKSALLVALFWWAWFDAKGSKREQDVRETIVSACCGCIIGIALVRFLSVLLPFRLRPLSDPSSGLHFPVVESTWTRWSAFPSDHAALFFFLATCLFSLSVLLGSLALLDAAFLICFPRIFLGLHHPTDILGGAAIGAVGAYWAVRPPVRAWLARPGIRWLHAHPASFYASAFLLTLLMAEVFAPVTKLLKSLPELAHLLAR